MFVLIMILLLLLTLSDCPQKLSVLVKKIVGNKTKMKSTNPLP